MMAEVDLNPLGVDWGLRFDEKEIHDFALRCGINAVHRKMRAMNAISIILQAHCTEQTSQDKPSGLHDIQAGGLFDALIELSGDGVSQSEDIGLRLITLDKGGQND